MATKYLFAVQDETGREVCSAYVEPSKVGNVTAKLNEEKDVIAIFNGTTEVASGTVPSAAAELHLHRVPAADKLANPVSKRIA